MQEKAEKKTAAAITDYETIEMLREKNGISNAVFEGVKAANGWRTGKQVTKSEFEKACRDFKNASIDGRKNGGKG